MGDTTMARHSNASSIFNTRTQAVHNIIGDKINELLDESNKQWLKSPEYAMAEKKRTQIRKLREKISAIETEIDKIHNETNTEIRYEGRKDRRIYRTIDTRIKLVQSIGQRFMDELAFHMEDNAAASWETFKHSIKNV
jgi:uncharacterized protein Yka (UPF0111/DUF47 family)